MRVGLVIAIVGAALITAEALGVQADVLTENLDEAVAEIQGWVEDLPINADAVQEVDDTARSAAPAVRDGLASGVPTLLDSAAAFVAGLILGTMVLYYLFKDGPTFDRALGPSQGRPGRAGRHRACGRGVVRRHPTSTDVDTARIRRATRR